MTPEQPSPAEPAGRVFVGRKAELGALRAGLDRANRGPRRRVPRFKDTKLCIPNAGDIFADGMRGRLEYNTIGDPRR